MRVSCKWFDNIDSQSSLHYGLENDAEFCITRVGEGTLYLQ